MTEKESNTPIIIDIGSSEIKAGFRGENDPSLQFPNYIGESKYNKIIRPFSKYTKESKDQFIGNDCQPYLGLLKLRYPVKQGSFTNESDIPTIFRHIFQNLDILEEDIKTHPLLITEPILNPKKNRETIASILFDQFNIHNIVFGYQPLLSLFSFSTDTGTVLESGDQVSQVCSVYDGYSIPCSFVRSNIGGSDVTEYLRMLLKHQGYSFHSDTETLLLKQYKHTYCCFPSGIDTVDFYDFNKNDNPNKNKIILPDKTEIYFNSFEKQVAPLVLINPSLIGKNCLGLHQLIVTSINRVDCDIRDKLFEQLNIVGGILL